MVITVLEQLARPVKRFIAALRCGFYSEVYFFTPER